MKRITYICFIILMLLLMVFPLIPGRAAYVLAKSPEDYLNTEEKAYVDAIRKADAAVRGIIANITVELWDAKILSADYYKKLQADYASLNSALAVLARPAPNDEFAEIAADYRDLSKYILASPSLGHDPAIGSGTFLRDVAYMLNKEETYLNELEGKLDARMGKVNAKVADIAKRQEMGEKILNSLVDSCLGL